jgi:hypothetical protein
MRVLMFFVLKTCWMCVSDVLIRELVRLKGHPGSEQQMTTVTVQLNSVIIAMKHLSTVFPLIGECGAPLRILQKF